MIISLFDFIWGVLKLLNQSLWILNCSTWWWALDVLKYAVKVVLDLLATFLLVDLLDYDCCVLLASVRAVIPGVGGRCLIPGWASCIIRVVALSDRSLTLFIFFRNINFSLSLLVFSCVSCFHLDCISNLVLRDDWSTCEIRGSSASVSTLGLVASLTCVRCGEVKLLLAWVDFVVDNDASNYFPHIVFISHSFK